MTKFYHLPKGEHCAVGLRIITLSSSKKGRQIWWDFPEDRASVSILWQRNTSTHVVQLLALLRPCLPCLTILRAAGALGWRSLAEVHARIEMVTLHVISWDMAEGHASSTRHIPNEFLQLFPVQPWSWASNNLLLASHCHLLSAFSFVTVQEYLPEFIKISVIMNPPLQSPFLHRP